MAILRREGEMNSEKKKMNSESDFFFSEEKKNGITFRQMMI